MEDDDENGRRFSLIRAPFPSLPDLSEYDQVAPFTKNDAGSLDVVCEAIYENLPIQHNPEAFSAETVHTPPGRLEPDNSQTNTDTTDFDNLWPDGTYCTIPGRAIKKYGSLCRRDSVDTVASSDNEAKREQKAAYRQELRKSSLIHVSDTNSIPVLEGLRKWASYRRISKEKAEENLESTHEKVYDTPNNNLNPYLTHRRAPKSSPTLPEQWKHSNGRRQTIVSPLESYNWDDAEASDQHAPPKKPPPRPAIGKQKKPILKNPISILNNDLKSDNVSNSQEGSGWFKKRIARLKRSRDNSEIFEQDTTDANANVAEEKEGKPFFYCKLISSYPKTAFGRFEFLHPFLKIFLSLD